MFAPFHYLTADLHRSARCFGLWANGRLAVFCGVLHRPHPKVDDVKGVSRVVTLPDFQGMGLAFALLDRLGAAHRAMGLRFRNYPAHPAFVRAHDRSPMWRLKKKPGQFGSSTGKSSSVGGSAQQQRPCAVFEYAGPAMERSAAAALIGVAA
jgi:GNAT superfamily N-acetyltransferase